MLQMLEIPTEREQNELLTMDYVWILVHYGIWNRLSKRLRQRQNIMVRQGQDGRSQWTEMNS